MAVLGGLYALAGLILSGRLLSDIWRAVDAVDAALGILLLVSAICGIWFLLVARRDLRGQDRHQARASS